MKSSIFFLKPDEVQRILRCNTNRVSKRFVFSILLGRFLPIKLRPLFGAVFFAFYQGDRVLLTLRLYQL